MDELTYKQEIEVAQRMWGKIVNHNLKACAPLRKDGLTIACLALAASENTDGYAIARELHDEYSWRPNAGLVAVLDGYNAMYDKALEEARDVIRQAAFEEAMEDKAQREKALEEIAKFKLPNVLI